ncbi:MAG: CoB--CoM heterodisulfide reductase iron-sulfur subunit B family protein [Pseudomonadota bacterium]
MKYTIQRCCTTNSFLKQYELSTDAVLNELGVDMVEIKDFNCCGYPLRNVDFKAHILLSSRNLSLAEKAGRNIMTLCNCCYGTLKHVNHLLTEDASLKEEVNKTLGKEGLQYTNHVEVRHLLEVLHGDIGIDKITEKVVKRFHGLKLATHYGCHILRPRHIIQFDNPFAPTRFDSLVEITGAKSIPWRTKLECCGSPVFGVDDNLSMDLTQKKIEDAWESGAHYLCVACCYCQLQFDRVQKSMISKRNGNHPLPSILYTQLLGLSMGIDEEALGIQQNEMNATGVTDFLS